MVGFDVSPALSSPESNDPGILVVDLDGTLTRSDLLYETFWTALSKHWGNVIPVCRALMGGKAHLKRQLFELSAFSVKSLPYNEDVVSYIQRWRQRGGRTALVSASDQAVVAAVAAHLGLFDEVHGSDGITNLKGPQKADFLVRRFPQGFTYMGDTHADYAIWQRATRAVTVDAPDTLRRRVEDLTCEAEHLRTRGSHARPLVRALRPHQWVKNVLVFLPMLAAHQFDLVTIGQALLAAVAFSLIASSVYILNDLLDLASDRAHPRKRARPFASGALPLFYGTLLAPGLLVAGLAISLVLGWTFVLVMLGYYVTTVLYSFDLKRRIVIDICVLAGLYTLRIIAGAVATGIPLSMWLLGFSIFFFFALAAMKRQAELVSGAASGEVKAHGRGYTVGDLPFVANMAVSSGYVSVLILAFYLESDDVQVLYSTPSVLSGVCLVLLYWLSRMVMVTHRGWMHDDPVVFAARDPNSLACAGIIVACAVLGTML
ncbi:UbiA family prenyltransferase [Rubellimicrobium rubrum]|uniref:UbiA family prenyltransferase n=2 Tax=Rubellimicrobium rubrum TaxID=2585369 RepID=A0A5C4N5X8_9RHOB|nr:UbiA family prenyltransferase [Rubellimicrobium rubrum]